MHILLMLAHVDLVFLFVKMSSIYAVVDKTKRKDRSIPKKEIESDEADSGLPLYAVVDEKKEPKLALECPEDDTNSDIVTFYSKKVTPSIAIKNASNCDGWREKKLIIAMILITVLLLLCVMSICFALTDLQVKVGSNYVFIINTASHHGA